MKVTILANDVVPSATHPQMSQFRAIIAKNHHCRELYLVLYVIGLQSRNNNMKKNHRKNS